MQKINTKYIQALYLEREAVLNSIKKENKNESLKKLDTIHKRIAGALKTPFVFLIEDDIFSLRSRDLKRAGLFVDDQVFRSLDRVHYFDQLAFDNPKKPQELSIVRIINLDYLSLFHL